MDPETGSATGFACGEEALADLLEDLLEDWVVAAGDEGGHVECGSHRGASAADDGLAFPFPRLACPWGEPDQGCYLPTVESAQFGEFCDQGTRACPAPVQSGAPAPG